MSSHATNPDSENLDAARKDDDACFVYAPAGEQVAPREKSTAEDQEEPGDAKLWAFKRARQRADIESVRAGRVTPDQLSWFSGGKARRLKLINSPY